MRRKSKDRETQLRKEAEANLNSILPDDVLSEKDAKHLVHELRVHQVELEMQNEELRKTQAQIEESRSKYADLYDFAPVGYLTLDENGLILEANLSAAGQLGTDRSLLVKNIFHSFVFDQDRKKSRLHILEIFKTRERQTCEIRLRAKGGAEFFALLESIFVETAGGTGLCRTSILDISRAKGAEEALRCAHDELEKRVEERTAELARANELLRCEIAERRRAEENLKLSMEKLKRSSQELQDFAYSASHDMQEPLRKIQVFGAMINLESLDARSCDSLRRMVNAAGRMSDMVRGLLDFSRVNTKGEPFTPVDLTWQVQEAAKSVRRAVGEADASLEIGELPTLDADPAQMYQLFKNLIENSLKFRSEKKPVIKIYSKRVDDPERLRKSEGGQYYDIFVEDNGIGFDELYLDRIFTLFQRLHGRSAYEGTGMGLPICRRIVERHRGSITARSKPGQGTTIIITLPSKKTDQV